MIDDNPLRSGCRHAFFDGLVGLGDIALRETIATIRVFIENEAGSATKHIYDEQTLEFVKSEEVARPYPYPYGFVLDTLGGDGDSVDCFVVTDRPMHSADIIDCIPVHLLEQIEDDEIDHKILSVPTGSPAEIGENTLSGIRSFIESVFSHIPGKKMQLGSLHGAAEARRYIQSCSLLK